MGWSACSGRLLAPTIAVLCPSLAACALLVGLGDYESPRGGSDAEGEASAVDATGDDHADGRWCQQLSPPPTFCSDFDTDPFAAEWGVELRTRGGMMAPDYAIFRSTPRSFSATVPSIAGDAGDFGRARFCHDAPVAPAEITLLFDGR